MGALIVADPSAATGCWERAGYLAVRPRVGRGPPGENGNWLLKLGLQLVDPLIELIHAPFPSSEKVYHAERDPEEDREEQYDHQQFGWRGEL